jgi:hypothetical protein
MRLKYVVKVLDRRGRRLAHPHRHRHAHDMSCLPMASAS